MKNNNGFSLMNLIVVITIIGFIVVGILTIIKFTKADKTYNDINSSVSESAKQRKAEMIISSVELAYASAVLENGSNSPTLESIKNKFDVQGAEWTDNGIETNLEFTCNVDLTDNNLHVTCLELETQKKMHFIN